MKAKHLVVDAGPLIKGCNLYELGEKLYLIPEVITEIRDGATRSRLQALPFHFEHRSIPPEILKIVTEFSKKTGDYPTLSATDLRVIALTYLLEKENVGTDHLKAAPQPIMINQKTESAFVNLPGFYNPDDEANQNENTEPTPVEELKPEEAPVVACLTTDFAMQNVLIQMGLKVLSVNGMAIRQARTFILRCYACFKTTTNMTKVFCPKCGNKTLKRVAYTLNEDGTPTIYINFKKPINIRGTNQSIPKPKGGKHSNNPILVEDQPMPHQEISKQAKMKTRLDLDGPLTSDIFAKRDVNSRSAFLGIKPRRR